MCVSVCEGGLVFCWLQHHLILVPQRVMSKIEEDLDSRLKPNSFYSRGAPSSNKVSPKYSACF